MPISVKEIKIKNPSPDHYPLIQFLSSSTSTCIQTADPYQVSTLGGCLRATFYRSTTTNKMSKVYVNYSIGLGMQPQHEPRKTVSVCQASTNTKTSELQIA